MCTNVRNGVFSFGAAMISRFTQYKSHTEYQKSGLMAGIKDGFGQTQPDVSTFELDPKTCKAGQPRPLDTHAQTILQIGNMNESCCVCRHPNSINDVL